MTTDEMKTKFDALKKEIRSAKKLTSEQRFALNERLDALQAVMEAGDAK